MLGCVGSTQCKLRLSSNVKLPIEKSIAIIGTTRKSPVYILLITDEVLINSDSPKNDIFTVYFEISPLEAALDVVDPVVSETSAS